MKKTTIIAVIAALALLVSGCDFIRQIAGRPTSDQLEAMDAVEVVDPDAPADSLCCADTLCCKDTVCCNAAPCDSCKAEKACGKKCEKPCEAVGEPEPVAEPEPVVEPVAVEKPAPAAKPAPKAKPAPAAKPAPKAAPKAARVFPGPVCKKAVLENKYYVVIGTFANCANAAAQAVKAEKAGYKVVFIPFENYLTAVTVAPTDNRAQALKSLEEVKTKKFCPADAYVLVVK